MSFRLIHLSDPHLAPLPPARLGELASKRVLGWANWRRGRVRVHRAEVLDAVVAAARARAADHVAVTGDLVNIALDAEVAAARRWLDGLGSPTDVSVVPGNHDAYVRGALERCLEGWAPFCAGDAPGGDWPRLRARGGVALILLSSAIATAPFQATGRLGRGQLERLERLLGELAGAGLCRVVLVHHPLSVPAAKRAKRLIDGDQFAAVLARAGAELVLHGHMHTATLAAKPGPGGPIPVVGVPSASNAPGEGHGDPAGFAEIDIARAGRAWRLGLTRWTLADGGTIAPGARVDLNPAT